MYYSPLQKLAIIILAIEIIYSLMTGITLAGYEARLSAPSSSWISTKPILIPDGAAGIVLVFSRGHPYAIGGATGCSNDPLCQVYDFVFRGQLASDGSVQNWIAFDPFTSPVAFASATTTSNGWIYVTGGARNASTPTNSTWYTLPLPNGEIERWYSPSSEITPFSRRFGHASVLLGTNLYVIGGFVSLNNILADVSYAKIDIEQGGIIDGWDSTEPLSSPRYGHSAVILNNRIYVIGGVVLENNNYVPTDTVVFAEPADNGMVTSWQPTKSLHAPTGFGPAIAVASTNKIYIFGGWNGADIFTKTVYSGLVNRVSGEIEEWVKEDSLELPEELFRHALALSDSGSPYLVGGKHPGDNGYRNSVYYIPPLTPTKSNDPSGPVHEGDIITYTIAYANTSLTTHVLTITDELPANVTYIPGSASLAPTTQQGSTLIWELGETPPGFAGQIFFQVRVDLLSPPQPEPSGVTSPAPNALPPHILPQEITCDTTTFWAHGVTPHHLTATDPYSIQVQIPPGANPSEMWLMMKETDNYSPTVAGQPAKLVTTTSKTCFGASLWSAHFTPTAVTGGKVVTVTTANARNLNALFLFDEDDPPFDEQYLEDFYNETYTKTYALEIPSVSSQNAEVILPLMDITDLKTHDEPPEFDDRLTTASIEFNDQTYSVPVNVPNRGNGLVIAEFPFELDLLGTRTATQVLTVTVDTTDSVYTLGPRVCRPVYIENTAWLCSDKAGCISDSAINSPPDLRLRGGIYLPLIMKSSP